MKHLTNYRLLLIKDSVATLKLNGLVEELNKTFMYTFVSTYYV